MRLFWLISSVDITIAHLNSGVCFVRHSRRRDGADQKEAKLRHPRVGARALASLGVAEARLCSGECRGAGSRGSLVNGGAAANLTSTGTLQTTKTTVDGAC